MPPAAFVRGCRYFLMAHHEGGSVQEMEYEHQHQNCLYDR